MNNRWSPSFSSPELEELEKDQARIERDLEHTRQKIEDLEEREKMLSAAFDVNERLGKSIVKAIKDEVFKPCGMDSYQL